MVWNKIFPAICNMAKLTLTTKAFQFIQSTVPMDYNIVTEHVCFPKGTEYITVAEWFTESLSHTGTSWALRTQV